MGDERERVQLLCKKCAKAYIVELSELLAGEARIHRCPRCKGILVKQEQIQVIPEEETVELSERDSSLPDDVRAALKENASHVGKFLLLKKLGKGGSGQVYRAFDLELERIVALKLFSIATDIDVERTRVEAQLTAKVNVQGIPKIYETGVDGETHFMAMEFIEGQDISEMKFPTEQAIRICADAARILEAAHSAGIVHRDVKPSNILLDAIGKVWMTDFGIAKSVQASKTHTTTGTVVGTPFFMSPEQARGENSSIDHRSDIFSLGSTLYFMVTYRFPFDGTNPMEIIEKVIVDYPSTPSSFNKAISREIDAVIFKAMEKERWRRYQRASEFAEDLERLLAREPVRALPVGFVGATIRRFQRHKRILMSVVAAAVLIMAAFGFAYSEYSKRKEASAASESLINAVLADLGAAYDEALAQRHAGKKYEELAQIPKRVLGSSVFREVNAMGVRDCRINFATGRLYKIVGDEEKAIAEQKQALEIDPEFVKAHYELGLYLYKNYEREIDRARIEWTQRESEKQTVPTEHELENDACRQLKSAALAHFQKGEPKDMCDAFVASLSSNHPAALEKFRSIQSGDKSNEEATLFLVKNHKRLEEFDKALQILAEAFGADRGNTDFLLEAAGIHLNFGIRKFYSGGDAESEWRLAIDSAAKAASLNEMLDDAWIIRGKSHSAIGVLKKNSGKDPTEDFLKAIDCYDSALKMKKDSVTALTGRGVAHMNLAVSMQSVGKSPREESELALKDFGRALDIDSKNASAHISRGTVFMNRGTYTMNKGGDPTPDFAGAIEEFNRAIAINANDYEVWLRRGVTYTNSGVYAMRSGKDGVSSFSLAVEDFNRAVDLNPSGFDAWQSRGSVYGSIGLQKAVKGVDPTADYEAAIQNLGKALQLKPNSYEALVNRGVVHTNLAIFRQSSGKNPVDDYKHAAADYEQAVKINPASYESWMHLGNSYFNIGVNVMNSGADPSEFFNNALKFLDKAIEINLQYFEAWMWRGNAKTSVLDAVRRGLMGGDAAKVYDDALKDYMRAIELNSNYGETFMRRAVCHCMMNKFSEAVADFNKGASLNPNIIPQFKGIWDNARKLAGGDY